MPNHIFQLITLMAMEPPISFEADAVRDEQTKILRAMQPLTPRGGPIAHGARPAVKVSSTVNTCRYRSEAAGAPGFPDRDLRCPQAPDR